MTKPSGTTPFDAFGGAQTIERLVEAFYPKVQAHPDLAPIFPDDLTETMRKQKQFLTQFLGGPPLYSQEHGHPMLRARHMPFKITPKRAEAWLSCMNKAIDEIELESSKKEYLISRLTMTAYHMVNHPE
ncbi:globin [Alkalihalobacillus sp. AL-G]|uniref:globin domain-containing protein n=1 Tax=Alkalihalobacillus sp. AL-G TaxID=2926399 RepID=UPI00272D01C5|nr:globin [Alkalihalobacillus sp. AL-G]WLD94925.1 globin [Alkalihalobacillus sp. AL-G]